MNEKEMKIYQTGHRHRKLRTLLPTLVAVYVPTFVVFLAVGFLAKVTGRHVWFFTNDPFVLGRLPFYAGIISNIGVLLWCASASICFFAGMTLGESPEGDINDWKRFLLLSGILTLMLLFDDLFQFHQILYPKYLYVTTAVVYGIYVAFAIWYLCTCRKEIQNTEFPILIFAFCFFALAIFCDASPFLKRGRTAISDVFKFFGIVSWLTYFVRTCFRLLAGQGGQSKTLVDDGAMAGRAEQQR
jgi:hypothetical protein